jgi:ABC-type antimicrobial peptide transport system permease subunit
MFSSSDSGRRVVIIDETFARQYWSEQDAVGKRLKFERNEPWYEVIGIVGQVRFGKPTTEFKPEVYVLFPEAPINQAYLLIRKSNNANIVDDVQQNVHRLSPGTAIFDVQLMDARIASSTAELRFATGIASVLAAIGLIVTLFGVYAFIVFSVNQRKYETGIRAAIGAKPWQLIYSHAGVILFTSFLGTGAGLAMALLFRDTFTRALPDVHLDIQANVALLVCGAILVIAVAAAFLAAYPASRIEPWRVLRHKAD